MGQARKNRRAEERRAHKVFQNNLAQAMVPPLTGASWEIADLKRRLAFLQQLTPKKQNKPRNQVKMQAYKGALQLAIRKAG